MPIPSTFQTKIKNLIYCFSVGTGKICIAICFYKDSLFTNFVHAQNKNGHGIKLLTPTDRATHTCLNPFFYVSMNGLLSKDQHN